MGQGASAFLTTSNPLSEDLAAGWISLTVVPLSEEVIRLTEIRNNKVAIKRAIGRLEKLYYLIDIVINKQKLTGIESEKRQNRGHGSR